MKFSYKNYFSFYSHPAHGSGFKAWLGVLSANNFAVDLAFLPKVFFITLTVIVSSPFRWYEKLRYRKALSKIKVKEPIFIIGHPRSGTTFLHYLMSRDPSFVFCNTVQAMVPHLFLSESRIIQAILSKALPGKRPMDNLKMGAFLPAEEEFAMASLGAESLISGYYFPRNLLRSFKKHVLFENDDPALERNWKKNFDYLLRKLSYSNQEKKLLLKSPGNTGRIPQILELFPDARFIYIYRNPFDVFKSNIHLFNKILPLSSFQHVKQDEIEEFVFDGYEALLKKYLFDRKLISSEKLVEIKYEEFIKDPLAVLKQVYEQLNLDGFEKAKEHIKKELESYSNYQKNVFETDQEIKDKIIERWRFAFDEFNYPAEAKI